MRQLCVATAIWLGLAVSASARDLYVDNAAGDDRFDGSTPAARGGNTGPCRTIARVLRVAGKGDRIHLANSGQVYRESITLQAGRHSGLPTETFQIIGNGAILDGAQPIPAVAWAHFLDGIFRFSPAHKAHQILFLNGKPAARVAVPPTQVTVPELGELEWCLFEREIFFRPEKGRSPSHYDLAHSSLTVGITLYEVRHVVIQDLIVQGFQLDGINAHDSVFDARLTNVTCRGNGRSGISVGGASRVLIEDSLLGDNGTAQLRTEGHSHTSLLTTELLDNTAPPIVRQGGTITHVSPEQPTAQQVRRAPPKATTDPPMIFIR